MPTYFKEQQFRHDVKEIIRISCCNGKECHKQMAKECKIVANKINFSGPIEIKATINNDIITISCNGINPINFGIYSYPYKINFEEKFDRGGY